MAGKRQRTRSWRRRLRNFFQTDAREQKTRRPSRILSVEPLEDRRMLDGTAFLVDSLSDVIALDGVVTLREAIQAANSNEPVYDAPAGSITEKDVITFDAALFANGPQAITLDGTSMSIQTDIVIQGPGAELLAIDANHQSLIFGIQEGRTAELAIGSEDSTMSFGKRSLTPHPLAQFISAWLQRMKSFQGNTCSGEIVSRSNWRLPLWL